MPHRRLPGLLRRSTGVRILCVVDNRELPLERYSPMAGQGQHPSVSWFSSRTGTSLRPSRSDARLGRTLNRTSTESRQSDGDRRERLDMRPSDGLLMPPDATPADTPSSVPRRGLETACMGLRFTSRRSDSPWVDVVWTCTSDQVSEMTSVAGVRCGLVFWEYEGRPYAGVSGPETATGTAPVPEGATLRGHRVRDRHLVAKPAEPLAHRRWRGVAGHDAEVFPARRRRAGRHRARTTLKSWSSTSSGTARSFATRSSAR